MLQPASPPVPVHAQRAHHHARRCNEIHGSPGFPHAGQESGVWWTIGYSPFVELLLPASANAPQDYRLSARVVTGISAGTSDSRIRLLKAATSTSITSCNFRSCTSIRATRSSNSSYAWRAGAASAPAITAPRVASLVLSLA